jgi:hypothetical protein
MYGKKVKWGAKAKLYLFRSGGLHDLGRHAVPRHGATPHNIGWKNLHGVVVRTDHGSIGLRKNMRSAVFFVSFEGAERFLSIPAEPITGWNV